MYSIYTLAALGLLVGIVCSCCGKRDMGKTIFWLIIDPFIGAVVGLFVGLIVFSSLVPMKDVVYGPGTLVAMRSSDGVSGTFVWGSGSIGSSVTYNFLQKMDDGSMSPRSVPANDLVALIEDPELKNTGFWRTTINEVDKTSALYKWSIGASDRNRTVRQEFRVPVGTVVQQFSIK